MKNFYSRMRNLKLPTKDEMNSVFAAFSKKERIVFAGLLAVLLVSTVGILESINRSLMVQVPFRGGTFSEGIIGAPRFINPVLASSPTDQDLAALIYSGLMRKNPDGTLAPDLAEKYEKTKDGLNYIFTLRDKIYFHDGEPVTADDVVFTVSQVKDFIIKSPRRVDWEGITAEKIDERTVKFTLKRPNSSFLKSAALGILPAHLWKNSPIELNDANTSPVGSGPYLIKGVMKESSGIINSYELASFKKFALGEPYITAIKLLFYQNEEDLIRALESGEVEQISSVTPANAAKLKEKNYPVESSVLPRVFGLFFNQNQNNLFLNKTVIKAIDQAIDKDRIIREVLSGYGKAIDSPMPSDLIAYQTLTGKEKTAPNREEILQNVRNSLEKDGWTKNEEGFLQKTITGKNKKKTTTALQFSISTGNAPELAQTAELIRQDLAALGMKVDVKTFELGNLNQSVIRPRQYDALLFGQIINNESDLYAFWHSSQRKDPGLNVAMYTNAKVDKILEEAPATLADEEQLRQYAQFEEEIRKDIPAVFLYSPNFIYVVAKNLSGFSMDHIASPADRFANVYSWYTKTENVWKIFSK